MLWYKLGVAHISLFLKSRPCNKAMTKSMVFSAFHYNALTNTNWRIILMCNQSISGREAQQHRVSQSLSCQAPDSGTNWWLFAARRTCKICQISATYDLPNVISANHVTSQSKIVLQAMYGSKQSWQRCTQCIRTLKGFLVVSFINSYSQQNAFNTLPKTAVLLNALGKAWVRGKRSSIVLKGACWSILLHRKGCCPWCWILLT